LTNLRYACGTFLGGTGHDEMGGGGTIAVYGGVVYMTGGTPGSYPVTAGAFQTVHGGGAYNAWIAQLCDDCTMNCSVLPIELLSFKARLTKNNLVSLEWVTASETNNDYFMVERSKDALHFEDIGKVKGKGNSNTITNYDFSDGNLPTGITYYRLQQVDYDGQYTYSKTISIEVEKGNKMLGEIIPNPATNQITYTIDILENALITIQIVDILGKISLEENKAAGRGRHSYTTDVSTLAKGMYFLKVSNQGVNAYRRFVK